MSHTQGKLAANADRLESEKEHGWANDGWIIAKCEGPDAFANTRRLVACWNACEHVRTEKLEGASEYLLAMGSELQKAHEERDELLEALKKMPGWIGGEWADNLRLILTKYKEAE